MIDQQGKDAAEWDAAAAEKSAISNPADSPPHISSIWKTGESGVPGAQMAARRVLIINLNTSLCPVECCEGLLKIIEETLAPAAVRMQSDSDLLGHPGLDRPDLIVLRPCLSGPLAEVIGTIKKNWSRVPLIGLFCKEWNAIPQTLLRMFDDFLFCPFKEIDLAARLLRLLHATNSRADGSSEINVIKEQFHLEPLVGESECFMREIRKVPCIASSEATVLISGETGTGKELFARAIHYRSRRQGKPFIPVNCGALPDHLFENELFGHLKGAYTDASSAQKGLIAEAESGTLFLDEIDALSPCAQIKLLRFLQDREYRPLGASKSVVADVRVVAATNAELRTLVEARRFREDLFYRLNVFHLAIPPLRERTGDILLLAAHFLAWYGTQTKRGGMKLSSEAAKKLTTYDWPGNVRELEGIIQQAVVLSASPTLLPEDLLIPISGLRKRGGTVFLREAKAQAVSQFERTYLTNLLTEYHGNISRAAKVAGKERRSFQRLLQKHGLNRQFFQL